MYKYEHMWAMSYIHRSIYKTQVYINECVYKCRYRAHIYVINTQDPKYISSQTQVIKRHKCAEFQMLCLLIGVWVACDGALTRHPRPFLLVHVCLHSCTGGPAEAEVCRPAGNSSAAHYLQGPPPLSLWGWAGQRALNSVSPVIFVDPSHMEPFRVSTNNLLSPFLTVGYYTSSIPRWLY